MMTRRSIATRGIMSAFVFPVLVATASLSAQPGAGKATETGAAAQFAIPATDDGLPGAGPIRRHDWFQKSWQERRATWATQVQQDRGAVVFVGDSITERWGRDLPAAFPGTKIANRGIGGDTTRGVLIRLEADVLALDPAAVVLLIGTNDLEEGAAPEVVASNLKLIIAAIEQHNPKTPIILCQVFPSSAQAKRPPEQIKALNALYLQVVKNHSTTTYLETWTMFADSNGNARVDEFPDQLHPNETGYAKWAGALRPILVTLGVFKEAFDAFTPEPGFVSLFNGRDLTGWGYRPVAEAEIAVARRRDASNSQPPARVFPPEAVLFKGVTATPEGRYVVVNGNLVVTTPPEYRKVQQLWTEKDFPGDFILKMEFRGTPNSDSGVYIRGPQLQVRDYLVAGPYNTLKKFRAQDWNELVITVTDNLAVCTCNGETIEAALKIPETGAIGLEGDRGQMEYRRIRIKVLP